MKLWHLVVLVALALPACSRVSTAPATASTAPPIGVAAASASTIPAPRPTGVAMNDQLVGDPKSFDNLMVFPIYAKTQLDVGPMTTLEAALAKGKAEVREVGANVADDGVAAADGRGAGAQVNALLIENKGDVPIYVLAGTVVKGGNQDRQIGQDFIIEPKQTASVDAFCVEHGRWTGERDGRATGGRFGTSQQLVTSSVRAAAQYKKNQVEVWSKVEEVNKAHKTEARSGTLFATLDDPEVAAKQSALAEKVNGFLASSQPNANLVGFGYAVDGQIRGVRWFASSGVFQLFRRQLVNGAAVDALTADAQRAGAPPPKTAAPEAKDVVTFVDDVQKAPVKERRDTAAGNANEYKESNKAYGSSTMRKPARAATAAPKPVSWDVMAK